MICIEVIEKNKSVKLCQWDADRYIKISAPEGIEVSHADFAHERDIEAIRREVTLSDGIMTAKIPNSLLQRNGKMRVWLVCDDVTIHGDFLVVTPKIRDEGYVLPDDEDEVYNYTSLAKRVAEIEKNGGSGGSNKTLLGEVVRIGTKKIKPLSIDYATGVITVDDCSFLPNGVINKYSARCAIRKNTDKVYCNNVVPAELQVNFLGIEKISENTLYLCKDTSITSYTESETVDLNAWYIEYSIAGFGKMKIESLPENVRHLEVEVFTPSPGIRMSTCTVVEISDSDGQRYDSEKMLRPLNYADTYSFDSCRGVGGTYKGCGMPSRYMYDFRIIDDFIYVTGKKMVAIATTADVIPAYNFIESAFLLKNNGLSSIEMYIDNSYALIPEGSYIKVREVHD